MNEPHAIRRYSEHQMRQFAIDEIAKHFSERPAFTHEELKALIQAEVRAQLDKLPRKKFLGFF
jgi:hypothetical protein